MYHRCKLQTVIVTVGKRMKKLVSRVFEDGTQDMLLHFN